MSMRLTSYKFLLYLFIVLAGSTAVKADGILFAWSPRDLEGVTSTEFEKAKKWKQSEILLKLRTATEWPQVYLLGVAAKQFQKEDAFLDSLVKYVSDTAQLPLTKTKRLIIWGRIASGEIFFEGKGLQVEDDLWRIGGRANWLLRNLTEKNPGYVPVHAGEGLQQDLQEKWKKFRRGKNMPEYKNPFPCANEGLEEIRSMEALEALIISLKPSDAKSAHITHCLKTLYNLERLPSDPAAPGGLCNPDVYATLFLSQLTGIEEPHDDVWWAAWWKENNSKLRWNEKDGMFEVKAAED